MRILTKLWFIHPLQNQFVYMDPKYAFIYFPKIKKMFHIKGQSNHPNYFLLSVIRATTQITNKLISNSTTSQIKTSSISNSTKSMMRGISKNRKETINRVTVMTLLTNTSATGVSTLSIVLFIAKTCLIVPITTKSTGWTSTTTTN